VSRALILVKERHAEASKMRTAFICCEPPVTSSHRRSIVRLTLFAAGIVCAIAAAWYVATPRSVTVVHPLRGPAVQAVYATGTVESSVMLPIAARVSGRLLELNSDEGSLVHKGEALGRLDDADLKSALAQLRSEEAFARRDYERNAALAKTGVIARSVFDRSRADWVAASAASAKAAAELNYARLVAPADGIVIHRDGEVGQLIPANQAVFWISVESPPRISAEVDEEDIARVRVGQDVLIRADAFPGRIFHGQVQSITPKGDPVARSYRVRVGFTEQTPLLIGMTTETNIVVRKDERALLLPPSAIQNARVWRVQNGRLQARTVKLGANGADAVEILDGVVEGDSIVAVPDAALHANQRVRAKLVAATKP
jgi:RND family efflux transporter MFP subunit